MAAPLFLGVGLLIGLIKDSIDKKKSNNVLKRDHLKAFLPIPLLLLMSLEGTSPYLSFSRNEVVSVTRSLTASVADVEKRLSLTPNFKTPPSGILGIGFPIPLGATGEGLALGDTRIVHFSEGEGRPPGDLKLKITERHDGFVRFTAEEDTSHIPHWLNWTASEVSWIATSPTSVEVTWTIHFERKLDPAWYFSWPQRMVVEQAANYLIQTSAMP